MVYILSKVQNTKNLQKCILQNKRLQMNEHGSLGLFFKPPWNFKYICYVLYWFTLTLLVRN